MDIEKVSSRILNVVSVEEFEDGGLLSMILIATSELTSEPDVSFCHPYIITRCINAVRKKNTRKRRGKEDRDKDGKLVPIENEGEKEYDIAKECGTKNAKLFDPSKAPPRALGILDSKHANLICYRLNDANVVTTEETASLFMMILSKKDRNGGIFPEASVDQSINEGIEAFHGPLSAQEIAEHRKSDRAHILNLLLSAGYLQKLDYGPYRIPVNNRWDFEKGHLKYLVKKAVIDLKKARKPGAKVLERLLSDTDQ